MNKKHYNEHGEWEVCLCFQVTENKLRKYCRLNNPKCATELHNCYGAGTGCGCCIPDLEQIFKEHQINSDPSLSSSILK